MSKGNENKTDKEKVEEITSEIQNSTEDIKNKIDKVTKEIKNG